MSPRNTRMIEQMDRIIQQQISIFGEDSIPVATSLVEKGRYHNYGMDVDQLKAFHCFDKAFKVRSKFFSLFFFSNFLSSTHTLGRFL